MRALQLVEWKHPPEFRDVPEPEPGPGEVVLRIAGSGACHSDLHLMHDFEAGLLPWGPPFTLGHENAGWVDAVGAGVTGLEIGEPVLVHGPWGCGALLALSRRAWRTTARTRPRSARPAAGSGSMGAWRRRCSSRTRATSSRSAISIPIDAAPLSDAGLDAVPRDQAIAAPPRPGFRSGRDRRRWPRAHGGPDARGADPDDDRCCRRARDRARGSRSVRARRTG